eukprot:CAMPEP_0196577046 /NCGR_PEP_ID=MMETSP1081-20130531/6191_1 /TAXON_ID=36882 /ORGANISM="Pyramimonas amylifera, Strain CCMP720" /LENGTH=87 /DNA_ID=CAMNT_0041895851 /DNA_START=1230 /DNA_END=1493 /DNA_ORIENTATION=+
MSLQDDGAILHQLHLVFVRVEDQQELLVVERLTVEWVASEHDVARALMVADATVCVGVRQDLHPQNFPKHLDTHRAGGEGVLLQNSG